MKKRLLLMVMVLLLLVGCTPDAAGPSGTNATTQPTTAPELKKSYPTPLESEFAVCFNKIDKILHRPTLSDRIYFYIVTKNSITPEEVSVKTGDIVWTVELSEKEKYQASGSEHMINQANIYPSFMAYKNVDWKALYALAGESISSFTDAYNQHMEECSQKWQDWFPEFHCYYVMISSPNGVDPDELDVENGHTETDLTITVKGETQVLKDICNIRFYPDLSAMPSRSGPLGLVQVSLGRFGYYPTEEGYFYSNNDTHLRATEDLTITGADFLNCETASFVKMQLIVGDVRIDWDGKTPVDVAAGDDVQFRFIAKDPTVSKQLVADFNRTAMLTYTCDGVEYISAIDQGYYLKTDPYASYAIANGCADAMYIYYADYYSKATGWYPGYVKLAYNGVGGTGNPFEDY